MKVSNEFGAKMGARWAQAAEVGAKLAASCAQDWPYWRQDGHLGLNLGGFEGMLGRCLGDLYASAG